MKAPTIPKVVASSVIVVALVVGAFAMISAASNSERPEFGLDPKDGGPVPEYVAVSDGEGGVAGYAELALMDGTGVDSQDEMARLSGASGMIVPVYDKSAQIVGYFASQTNDYIVTSSPGDDEKLQRSPNPGSKSYEVESAPSGFIPESTKNELVAEGFLYIEGTQPQPESAEGSADKADAPVSDTLAPNADPG